MNYRKVREAVFVSRPNRFIANVIIDGEKETVHVKNTGRCKELLYEGAKVYLEDYGELHTARKTRYSLVTVEKTDRKMKSGVRYVNIDSQAPNRVMGEALRNGRIVLPEFDSKLTYIKPEMTYGASRFDFYMEDEEERRAYLEVKGVTLEENGMTRFPDAPTERGLKHIKELCNAVDQGFFAYLVFVIQMKGVSFIEPNEKTHPAFGEALREARNKGVFALAYDCNVTPDSITIGDPVAVKL